MTTAALQREGNHAKPSEAGAPGDPEIQTGKGRLMHKFEIILYGSDEDRAFVAEVPGCMAHGDS